MHVKLRQIEAFVLAAETLSFSRAADRLAVTQPAFSQLIREMEQTLGLKLFDRTTRRVALTEAGHIVLDGMKRGMSEIQEACKYAGQFSRSEVGQLSIGALPSLAVGLVGQVLSEFRTQFPSVRIRLYEDHNGAIIEKVAEGEVDFAVCARCDPTGRLEFEELFKERMTVVVAANNPLAGKPSLQWKDLVNQPLILTNAQSNTNLQVKRAFEQNGITKAPDFEVLNMFTAITFARMGLGVTIMPATFLHEVNMTNLVCVPLCRPVPHRSIGICRIRGKSLSPSASRLLQMLHLSSRTFLPPERQRKS
jgi:DNA-binding transcriptional LysR family regulator